jgi:hypothetical protein
MRGWPVVRLIVGVGLGACDGGRVPEPGRALDVAHARAISDSVRAFAGIVAQGVSRAGPAAWREFFEDGPAFFMAAEGQLVFPTSDSATHAIRGLAQRMASIELRWGVEGVRVDPLGPGLAVMAAPYTEVRVDKAGRRVEEAGFFTGIAEHRDLGWQFRDAHWSVAGPPSRVP